MDYNYYKIMDKTKLTFANGFTMEFIDEANNVNKSIFKGEHSVHFSFPPMKKSKLPRKKKKLFIIKYGRDYYYFKFKNILPSPFHLSIQPKESKDLILGYNVEAFGTNFIHPLSYDKLPTNRCLR